MNTKPGTFVPARVSAVSIYGVGPMRSLSIRDATKFVVDNGGERFGLLILGAMRPGYLGREALTLVDLERWVAELDAAGIDFGRYCHDHNMWIASDEEWASCPRCEHEKEDAAEWAYIADCERAMAEMGALR